MNHKFLIRPKPYIDETFQSYIERIAVSNNYPPHYVYQLLGISHLASPKALACHHDVILRASTKMESLCQLSEGSLSKNHFTRSTNGRALVWKDLIIPNTLTLHSPRTCPACLATRGSLRAQWYLTCYMYCPLHDQILIDGVTLNEANKNLVATLSIAIDSFFCGRNQRKEELQLLLNEFTGAFYKVPKIQNGNITSVAQRTFDAIGTCSNQLTFGF